MKLRFGHINILVSLYSMEFRGKKSGKFALSRTQFKQILDVPRLDENVVYEVSEDLFDKGFSLLDLDDVFIIEKAKKIRNVRRPSKDILNKLLGLKKTETVKVPAVGDLFLSKTTNIVTKIVEISDPKESLAGVKYAIITFKGTGFEDEAYDIDRLVWNDNLERWAAEEGYNGQ